MIQSCVTISLVDEAGGKSARGPFVFWDDLQASCRKAKELGFDAVEIFAPAAHGFDADALRRLLGELDLKLAALGTGAGWVIHRKHLCSADAAERQDACEFIRSIIDDAGAFGASAIIGSMQGRHGDGVDKKTALGYLAEALNDLGEHAGQYSAALLFEPLNRYETNLVNTIDDGVKLIETLNTGNVKLLADLFHMNIEETDIAEAIRGGKGHIGHLHFVDSNRRAAGMGHMDYGPICKALAEIGYDGYACAEAFSYPNAEEAARKTIETFRKFFR